MIALRLVMFAVASHGHGDRRSVGQDAVATARPDILDRNGGVLATDVKAPSLYAEPRKLIDVDDAEELLTAVLPDLDAKELRERLSSKRGFVWLKREITPKQQQEIHRLGIPGVGFLTENKRVYPNGPVVSHVIGLVNIDNQGIAGMEKWLDGQGLAALHMAGLATDRLQRPVQLSLDLRVQYALRDELVKAREKFKAKASPASSSTSTPARSSPWCRSPTTTRTIRARPTTRRASTGSPPASTRWARPSSRSPSPWRSTAARPRSTRNSTPARRCITAGSPSTTTSRRAAPSRCRRSSPIRRTSAPRAWRWRSASTGTRRS